MKQRVVAPTYQMFRFWRRQQEDQEQRSLVSTYVYVSHTHQLRGLHGQEIIVVNADRCHPALMNELYGLQKLGHNTLKFVYA